MKKTNPKWGRNPKGERTNEPWTPTAEQQHSADPQPIEKVIERQEAAARKFLEWLKVPDALGETTGKLKIKDVWDAMNFAVADCKDVLRAAKSLRRALRVRDAEFAALQSYEMTRSLHNVMLRFLSEGIIHHKGGAAAAAVRQFPPDKVRQIQMVFDTETNPRHSRTQRSRVVAKKLNVSEKTVRKYASKEILGVRVRPSSFPKL